MPDAPAQWGQAVSDGSRMPRRSVAAVLGASAGVPTTRSGAVSWLLLTQRASHTPLRRAEPYEAFIWHRCQMRFCGRQFLMRGPHRQPGVHLLASANGCQIPWGQIGVMGVAWVMVVCLTQKILHDRLEFHKSRATYEGKSRQPESNEGRDGLCYQVIQEACPEYEIVWGSHGDYGGHRAPRDHTLAFRLRDKWGKYHSNVIWVAPECLSSITVGWSRKWWQAERVTRLGPEKGSWHP